MATVIYPDGTREKINMDNHKKLKMSDISKLLGELIQPLYYKNKWVFFVKNGFLKKMGYNLIAEGMIGYPIFGPVLIVEPNELSDNFLNKENNNLEYAGFDKTNENYERINENETIYNTLYNSTFGKKMSHYEIMNNFILIENGKKINLSNNITEQIEHLNNMIDIFSENEEYEKCILIKGYLDNIDIYKVNEVF